MVGLGIMGSAMSKNLMAAGFQVVGYDVEPGRLRFHTDSARRISNVVQIETPGGGGFGTPASS